MMKKFVMRVEVETLMPIQELHDSTLKILQRRFYGDGRTHSVVVAETRLVKRPTFWDRVANVLFG